MSENQIVAKVFKHVLRQKITKRIFEAAGMRMLTLWKST